MRHLLLTKVVLGLGIVLAALGAPRVQSLRIDSCTCPGYYEPVTCSNGVTYTNQCFASCAHATGCVPGVPG